MSDAAGVGTSHKRTQPHKFGQFNVRRVKVVSWRVPTHRRDEDDD